MAGGHRFRRDKESAIRIATAVSTLALLVCAPAAAQTIEELERQLAERDAIILKLRQRIEALERQAGAPAVAAPRAAVPAPLGPAPGDDDELNRALERGLVQQGGLVLPAGAIELQPEFSYARWDTSRGAFQRSLYGPALSLRAGFSSDLQLQVRAPYWRSETALGSVWALGDIDLAVSKELARARAGRPAWLVSLGFTARTGQDIYSGKIPTGSGFDAFGGGLTAVKRLDPLVLFGGPSFTIPFARQVAGTEIEPGRAVGLRLGGILAASPETSVNLGLALARAGATRIGGQSVPDSDAVSGTLQIGFGTILTRQTLLNLTGDFRVLGPVPDFRLSASFPTRF